MLTRQELKDRYSAIERVPDALGRVVGVRRLKLSEQVRVEEMAPNSPGNVALIAAAICELDGAPLPFPRDRQELDHQLDLLDLEGMQAASTAWAALHKPAKKADGEPESDLDRAKKSQGTP